MAFSSKQASSRIRRRRYRPLSEINVTPFVDVMLVLLVVFMVTAPLLTIGIPLDLPKSDQSSSSDSLALNDTVEAVTITIDVDGNLFLAEEPTTFDTIIDEVIAQTGDNPRCRHSRARRPGRRLWPCLEGHERPARCRVFAP